VRDLAHWGPFLLQKEEKYGLAHYISVQKPGAGGFDEFFYDAKTEKTIITCANAPMKVTPFKPLSYCEHDFSIPKLAP